MMDSDYSPTPGPRRTLAELLLAGGIGLGVLGALAGSPITIGVGIALVIAMLFV